MEKLQYFIDLYLELGATYDSAFMLALDIMGV